MENYICINGNKTELTEEQLKQLGIKEEVKVKEDNPKRNNPFNSEPEEVNGNFYYITSDGVRFDDNDDYNAGMITTANSFNNGLFAKQVYLHELLNRKLLKYAYDNEAEDCEWNWTVSPICKGNIHYFIYKEILSGQFKIGNDVISRHSEVYFSEHDVAERAIADVVKPFMEEYPEFEW